MLSFKVSGSRFQIRAAAVILHEGYLLLHRAKPDKYWALPGGRVEMFENAAATIEREMREELAEPISCGNLLWVVENFFTLEETRHHELGLYFSASIQAESALLDKSKIVTGIETESRLEFCWFRQSDLHVIDLRPSFLCDVLTQPVLTFRHVVHHD